ncbi:MAG: SDR family oxidoreductase [Corynebacterium flavescens]|uniref:SDR family oxidoreductase n=1 Tax=Corynebacterium flavescens TaxID=28028 RepID=UPI002647A6D6|nr:SDR family oxidoreductase [Corynebacterium flavescens]MDN6601024.1 SDR family oxidoreductase [Corynebacterium flavescens]
MNSPHSDHRPGHHDSSAQQGEQAAAQPDVQPDVVAARHPQRRVLVTGATGYVGGRLIPELLAAGFKVRATSRRIDSLRRFPWFDEVEHAEADLSSYEDIAAAVEDVDVVFYLVHSMGKVKDFEKEEKRIAENVARAASEAGVGRIVYLSGLIPQGSELEGLSAHMRSRENVARTLLASEVDTIVLRAATLIGSGSASFEIIRHLSERLPLMLTPQWIQNDIEPIAIRDAVYYLVRCAGLPEEEKVNRGYDIGGGSVYKFKDLLSLYGRARGHRNRIYSLPIPLPMDTLSGGWISLVTPVPFGIAKPLAQSMAKDAVTNEHDIAQLIPDPPRGFLDYPTAVRFALTQEAADRVVTSWDSSWTAAAGDNPAELAPNDPDWAGVTVYKDERERRVDAPVERVWEVIEGIGGRHGWYSTPVLWKVRGILDRILGGPGLGGRRNPNSLTVGDRVDWWRVEYLERPHKLVLRAEMKVDGQAWLQLEVEEGEEDPGASIYKQTAYYAPRSWLGHIYWWGVAPFHTFVFPLMAAGVATAAEATRSTQAK